MKKFIIFLAIFLCIISFSCKKDKLIVQEKELNKPRNSSADTISDEQTSKPLIVISETDVLEILVRADGAPGMYLGEDGQVHGFYVELEKMVMQEMGQNYHLIPYSNIGDIYQGIKTGVYHQALSVPDVPDYRATFNLSIPFEILHYVTFVRNGNTAISGTDREEIIQSFFGKKIGVQTQGHIYQVLRDYKEIKLIEYETTTSALEALNDGLLDAVPDVKRIGEYYSEKNNWDIKSIDVPIISFNITTAFSKALDPSLLNRYNDAMKTIIDDGRLKKIWETYFGIMEKSDIP